MFIFVRHGETIYNTEGRFQGISDSSLTAKGILQAKKIHDYVKNYTPLHFFASPLPQALHTQSILAENLDSTVEVLEEIKEVCYGDWEGKTKEDLKNHPLWEVKKQDRFNFVHPGTYKQKKGESYKHLYNRIEKFLTKLLKKKHDKNIVLVSHLGVMRCVYKFFNKTSDKETGDLHIANNEIFVVDKKSDNEFSFKSIVL